MKHLRLLEASETLNFQQLSEGMRI